MMKNNRSIKQSAKNFMETSNRNMQDINNFFNSSRNNKNNIKQSRCFFEQISAQKAVSIQSRKAEKNYIYFNFPENSHKQCIINPDSLLLVNEEDIKKSSIIRLYEHLSELINSSMLIIKKEELEKLYYQYAFSAIENQISDNFDDIETLVINIKQLILMLRQCNYLDLSDGLIESKVKPIPSLLIYINLFNVFLNRVQWEELFPSMPDTARELNIKKYELLKLLLEQKDSFRIDRISEKIITKLSLSSKLNIYFISFLDFSVLTWLSYFGLIKYLAGKDNEPVRVKITEHGRFFLESILQLYM